MVVPINDKQVKVAVEIVKKGGLIIYPTETVYGLGCDPYNKKAVKKVFEVKGRTAKPLPLLVSSLKKALDLAFFPKPALKIAKKYWPGPLTLVLKRKKKAPEFLGGDPSLIGLRVSKHPVASQIVRLCGGTLVGTSANLSGNKPSTTAQEAAKQLGNKVDLILDGGKTFFGVSSTVLDFSTEEPKILRVGPISKDEILSFIEEN